jgi:hypothetical protein
MHGLTSSMRRRFSSRRVVPERETGSKICFAIGSDSIISLQQILRWEEDD